MATILKLFRNLLRQLLKISWNRSVVRCSCSPCLFVGNNSCSFFSLISLLFFMTLFNCKYLFLCRYFSRYHAVDSGLFSRWSWVSLLRSSCSHGQYFPVRKTRPQDGEISDTMLNDKTQTWHENMSVYIPNLYHILAVCLFACLFLIQDSY